MVVDATYHDGRSAAAHRVSLRVDPPHLGVFAADGRELARWPLAAIRHVEKPTPGQVVRLRNGFDADDRLTLPPGVDSGFLAPFCRDLGAGDPAWKRAWRPLLLWGAGALATLAFLFFIGVPMLAGWAVDALPQAWESRFGARMADQVVHVLALSANKRPETMVCAGERGQAALDTLAGRLAAGLDAPSGVRVRVVDTAAINAFTLPGGEILVLRGLLDFARDPNELAGVLAHEIGHAAHRDPIRKVFEQAGTAALFSLMFGDIFGATALAAIGNALVNASYSREKERAADDLGVRLMAEAGFDANGLAAFLERLRGKEGDVSGIMAFFASHPAFEERVAAARETAVDGGAALAAAEWEAVKEMCVNRR